MSRATIALLSVMLICAMPRLADRAWGQDQSQSVSSWPPDFSSHSRPATAEDKSVAQAALAKPALSAVTIQDVNSFNFEDGSEPSIAVSPANPSLIVVNGGFGAWGNGSSDVSMFVSTNGGSNWSLNPITSPPTGITTGLADCPCDTTIDFGAASAFSGSFLAGPTGSGDDENVANAQAPAATPSPNSIFSGTSTNLSSANNWGWFAAGGAAQKTNSLVAGSNPDQPWLLVNRDPINATMQNLYVAFDDFSLNPAGIDVAVALGTNPPDFVRNGLAGTSAGEINPGTRLAVDPGTGWVYDLFQDCPNNASGCGSLSGEKTINFVLNRSTDGGQTWSLNGGNKGVVVATAPSTQPNPKFGTVNALLGGIDHVTVDPNNGDVYVVYGDQSSGKQLIMLRRLVNNASGGLDIGSQQTVSVTGVDAALPSVAVAGGAVGVLYTTFDGMSQSGFPQFSAHLATSVNQGASFTDQTLLTFLSPAMDNGDSRQRVLGDYQQLKAVGSTFYGVFTGNGAALGRSQASSDPIFFTAPGAPTATPSPAAKVGQVTRVNKTASPGKTVKAGKITIVNNSNVTENVTEATISISHPTLFSAMTLSAGGQTQTLTAPGATATFTFASPIGVPAGGVATLELSAVIAMHPTMLDLRGFKFAGLIPEPSMPSTGTGRAFAASCLLLAFAPLVLPYGVRRRVIIVAAFALGLAAIWSGCGGSSGGGAPLVTSTQQVTGVTVTVGGASPTVEGLPQSLGKISS